MVVEVNHISGQLWINVREGPDSPLMNWDTQPLEGAREALVRDLVTSTPTTKLELGSVTIRLNFASTDDACRHLDQVREITEKHLADI